MAGPRYTPMPSNIPVPSWMYGSDFERPVDALNDRRAVQNQRLQLESNEIKMNQMREAEKLRQELAARYQENPAAVTADPLQIVTEQAGALGDADALLQVAREKRILDQQQLYEQIRQQRLTQPQLRSVQGGILQIDPATGEQTWLVPPREQSGPRARAPVYETLYDAEGNEQRLNRNDPEFPQNSQGLTKKAPKQRTAKEELEELMAEQQLEAMRGASQPSPTVEAPNLLERVTRKLQGVAGRATPSPASKPSPMPVGDPFAAETAEAPPEVPPGYKVVGRNSQTGKWQIKKQ